MAIYSSIWTLLAQGIRSLNSCQLISSNWLDTRRRMSDHNDPQHCVINELLIDFCLELLVHFVICLVFFLAQKTFVQNWFLRLRLIGPNRNEYLIFLSALTFSRTVAVCVGKVILSWSAKRLVSMSSHETDSNQWTRVRNCPSYIDFSLPCRPTRAVSVS